MANLYQQVLTKVGLDEEESKVYLAALGLKSAPASEIAKKASLVRSTCYGVLEKLVQKGLASKTEKPGGIRQFVVENPELLLAYLEAQKADFEQSKAEIKNILPDLRNMQGEFGFKPQIEYFEGKSGIIATLESIMPDIKRMAKAKIPLLIHGTNRAVLNVWPQFPEYVNRRAKTGIEARMLIWEKMPPEFAEIQKTYKVRYLSKRYAFRAGTNILDEKIVFFDFENLMAVVIKNKIQAEAMRVFFDCMWEGASQVYH